MTASLLRGTQSNYATQCPSKGRVRWGPLSRGDRESSRRPFAGDLAPPQAAFMADSQVPRGLETFGTCSSPTIGRSIASSALNGRAGPSIPHRVRLGRGCLHSCCNRPVWEQPRSQGEPDGDGRPEIRSTASPSPKARRPGNEPVFLGRIRAKRDDSTATSSTRLRIRKGRWVSLWLNFERHPLLRHADRRLEFVYRFRWYDSAGRRKEVRRYLCAALLADTQRRVHSLRWDDAKGRTEGENCHG